MKTRSFFAVRTTTKYGIELALVIPGENAWFWSKKGAGTVTACEWSICRRMARGQIVLQQDYARFFERELFLALGPQGFRNNNSRFDGWQAAQHI